MNEATVNGQAYVARPTPRGTAGTCAGCAAMDPRMLSSEQRALCAALPPCQAARRDDGRFIVWVRDDG